MPAERSPAPPRPGTVVSGHGGQHAVAAAVSRGVRTMFTLSGAHVFPMYDAAVGGAAGAAGAGGPLRLVDVRHEQTAVFAAEATGRLTRTPGLAVLTAGPGVTNGVSAIAGAWFSGSPLVVLGGRAPAGRWGTGALQELDHPPILSTITKSSRTIDSTAKIGPEVAAALDLAGAPHRGPVFADIPMDVLFSHAEAAVPTAAPAGGLRADPSAVALAGALLARSVRPVVVLSTDVWAGGAEHTAAQVVAELGLPVVANGMGRGVLGPDNPLLVSRARALALGQADVVVVVGTALDFRLGYGRFGGRDGQARAAVVQIVDSAEQVSAHAQPAAALVGDIGRSLRDLVAAHSAAAVHRSHADWAEQLRLAHQAGLAADKELLGATSDPIHPARIYGELLPRLADDAVLIGDGGDFVSFAGRFHQPQQPGRWLDPGPYGCLGTGPGYAAAARIAHPGSQVVLLLGDGAAGFSLMDVDTLVRHKLPVVMVVANNSAWGLEKHPMNFLYGYDVAADLAPTRYDQIVTALGGAGEQVGDPAQIGPALDRAFDAGVPYLVNVMTDPAAAYPRSTTGV